MARRESLADEAKLPTLEWADHPEWSYGGGLFHIQCDYRLMVDNLMDLTHETYVHSSSIGQKRLMNHYQSLKLMVIMSLPNATWKM